MSSTGDLLRDLQAADPAVGSIVKEHLADHDEVLPHLLMADITRWLVHVSPRARVLDVLERHSLIGDAHVQDVIGASFLENLLGEDAAVRDALGPHLAAELARMENWDPDIDPPPT